MTENLKNTVSAGSPSREGEVTMTGGAMSKHTPGPWEADRHYVVTGRGRLATIHPPSAHPDAFAEKRHDEGWLDAYLRLQPERIAIGAEQEANATLMAAAPELLEALKVIVNSVETTGNPEWRGSLMHKQCRAAIAKAEGEQ